MSSLRSPDNRARVFAACELCGTRFLTWAKREQRFCSRSCFGQWRRLNPTPVRERLERLTDKSAGAQGCWPWLGSTVGHDPAHQYGHFDQRVASRATYEEYVGLIPRGLYVLHRCNNGLCQNPAHLYLGTQADNARDRGNAGHHRGGPRQSQRGAQNNGTHLCDEQVKELRALYAAGMPVRELRTRYGLSDNGVRNIVRGISWRHIGEPIERARVVLRGAAHARAKLSPAQVSEIRHLRSQGLGAPTIAARYGISSTHVYALCKGQSRRDG